MIWRAILIDVQKRARSQVVHGQHRASFVVSLTLRVAEAMSSPETGRCNRWRKPDLRMLHSCKAVTCVTLNVWTGKWYRFIYEPRVERVAMHLDSGDVHNFSGSASHAIFRNKNDQET